MAIALNSRRITVIVAVTVALIAGLLTIRYLNGAQHATEVATTVPTRSVIVASRAIHPHERIVAEMLARVTKPIDQVEVGTYSEVRQALNNIALIEIPEGAPLTEAKVGVPASIGITGKLTPGLRAVSIPVDFIKSVSSLVAPGDRVDVLASNTRGRARPTRAIIRGALVLAVNAILEPNVAPSGASAATTSAPVSVTLAVTPDQANLLTYADDNTLLRLALRSPKEPIRAFPVQEIDIGDESGVPAPRSAPHSGEPSVYIVPPAVPAQAPGNVPAPSAPVVAPGAGVPQARKPILVIEGDQIVAGQH